LGEDETLDRGFWQLGGSLGARVLLRQPVRRGGLSRAELYEEAQRLGIRGRSRMKKAELGEAIRAARAVWWRRGFVAALLSYLASADRGLRSLLAAGATLHASLRPLGGSLFGREAPRRLVPRHALSQAKLNAPRLGLRGRSRLAALAGSLRATRVASWTRAWVVALLSCLASADRGLRSLLAAGPTLHAGLPPLGGRLFGRETPRRLAPRHALSQAKPKAPRLGLGGRSSMEKGRSAWTMRTTGDASRSRGLVAAYPSFFTRAYQTLASLRAGFAFAFLRRPEPVRVMVLSVAAVAAGALGLMTAYAVSPEENSAAQVLVTNGSTLRIATVTGPGGTTTVAITKTKQGKTRLVPVRILQTVTGPGETETVSVAVLGPPLTVTDRQLLTQIQTLTNEVTNTRLLTETQVVKQTQTQVVTETQPVTVVVTDVVTEKVVETQIETVTQTDTVVETDTVVVTDTVILTETVQPPPP
jgi:hypothetical protein